MNRTPLALVILTVVFIAHGMHTADTDKPIPSKLGTHPEKFTPKAAESHIDRIAKVIQSGISPSRSHYNPVSGARA